MKKLLYLPLRLFFIVFIFVTCSKEDDTPIQYSLSVEVTPSSGGSVTPSSGNYENGETITLLATPSPEYIFMNWSGGATGTNNPTTVIMNSDKSVSAVFEKRQYSLTIEIEGQGTVKEELLSSKPASNFPSGSSVRLTAVPLEGWEFVEWSGDLTGVDNPITISIDKAKNVKVKFRPILYNQILGKWDVNNLNGKPSLKKSISNRIAPYSLKSNDGDCIVYSLVFNSDGSFILSLSSGEIKGTFYFDSANSIVLNNNGKIDNIHINNNTLNFHLNLNNLCSSDETAEEDEDYVEGECVSFLDCNDGTVWLLQSSVGPKYIRLTNDLGNVWIEHYTFDVNRQCTIKSMTNKISEYNVILLENNINKMTYVLDNTPNGDVSVILNLTADNHLSVKYDYINNDLDETDYYVVSSVDSLNGYINSYSECQQLTYVPDDNFEQYLIDLGYDDMLDDYVLTSNIVGVVLLHFGEARNITNTWGDWQLTGIEDFLGLKSLKLYANVFNIKSINFYNNTNLESLTIYEGYRLDTIDVSSNLNLKELKINQFFGNKTLDISKNTQLINLDLRGNGLSCIKVNQTQLNNLPANWYKDEGASYSLDCSLYQAGIPTDGLIGYWPFNGNANDVSGNGNNGIKFQVSETQDRYGNINSAYYFDGINSYIDINIPNVPINNSSRTISGWFKGDSSLYVGSKTNICIFNYGQVSSLQRFSLYLYNKGYLNTITGIDFNYSDNATIQNNHLDNKWYFFTIVFDGSNLTLYVNGKFSIDFSNSVSVKLVTTNSVFRIGKRIPENSIDENFKGIIDDIAIYNRALTQEEITILYNSK